MLSFNLVLLNQCKSSNLYRTVCGRNFSLFFCESKRCVKLSSVGSYSSRNFHDFEVNKSVQNKYRKLDNVSNDYYIIYRAPLMNYIKIAHYASVLTAPSLPICTLVYLFYNGPFIFPIDLGKLPLIRNYYEFAGFYGGFYLLISQLFLIIFRYPVRVYKDSKDNYVAVYRGILPWISTKESYKAGEAHKVSSFMPWGDCLYQLKSRKAILLEEHFLKPIDLHQMLGNESTDKPESKSDS